MGYLLFVSLIWAASFSLIKTFLVTVQPDVVNAIRLGLTLAVFLPFLRSRGIATVRIVEFLFIGAIQFGAMYYFYTRSFGTLKAYEAALATIMTPLYVTLLDDALERRFRPTFLACALLSAVGTAVAVGVFQFGLGGFASASLTGLALIQASNLCFAVGQVWYRRAMAREGATTNTRAFAWCAVGAAVVAGLASAPVFAAQGWPALSGTQWGVLVYLGVVSSGLCFFLWNVGARKVNTGVLAVMNDLKIPSAMLVALVVFGERAAWARLAVGGTIILAALWMAARAGATLGGKARRA